MVLISGKRVVRSNQCTPCGTCQSLGALIQGFDVRIPEMQNVCIAMSSPVAMTICMFLMISRKDRRRLLTGKIVKEGDVEKGASLMSQSMGIDFTLDN